MLLSRVLTRTSGQGLIRDRYRCYRAVVTAFDHVYGFGLFLSTS